MPPGIKPLILPSLKREGGVSGVRRLRSTTKSPPISELRLDQEATDHGDDAERESACLKGYVGTPRVYYPTFTRHVRML
jgi:hypothetical protein